MNFMQKKFCIWLNCQWSHFLRVWLDIALMAQVMAWDKTGEKQSDEHMIAQFIDHKCINRYWCFQTVMSMD